LHDEDAARNEAPDDHRLQRRGRRDMHHQQTIDSSTRALAPIDIRPAMIEGARSAP
jgi:hypothetical protein